MVSGVALYKVRPPLAPVLSPTPCRALTLPSMAGTPRSAKVREALEARAKAMRREGASMAEIERETGVPAPTLHQ